MGSVQAWWFEDSALDDFVEREAASHFASVQFSSSLLAAFTNLGTMLIPIRLKKDWTSGSSPAQNRKGRRLW